MPPELVRRCGELRLRRGGRSPFVFANFASTLDGVVALRTSGITHTADVVGPGNADRVRMGLLRAVADVIVVGGGTVRSAPRHDWSPGAIAPGLTREFAALRERLGLEPVPVRVVVTSRGEVDVAGPIVTSAPERLVLLTTGPGARRLRRRSTPRGVRIAVAGSGPRLRATAMLRCLRRVGLSGRLLIEGGPHLLASFLEARCLDELFLTVSPRVAGRDRARPRLGLAEGIALAPDRLVSGRLLAAGTSEELLFLRYGFPRAPPGSF